eukprot:TRINITY_DN5580_c0_g4_i1.p1 TRINITY_DN5580_c0_g4~~TRINITY_DN5580_c0_g4_i1.p1  ORF type:complete len:497 (+),score=60.72 TRINITY_DN5580_c0_g4_i1:132-1622(+)
MVVSKLLMLIGLCFVLYYSGLTQASLPFYYGLPYNIEVEPTLRNMFNDSYAKSSCVIGDYLALGLAGGRRFTLERFPPFPRVITERSGQKSCTGELRGGMACNSFINVGILGTVNAIIVIKNYTSTLQIPTDVDCSQFTIVGDMNRFQTIQAVALSDDTFYEIDVGHPQQIYGFSLTQNLSTSPTAKYNYTIPSLGIFIPCIKTDCTGGLWVCDYDNNRVLRILPNLPIVYFPLSFAPTSIEFNSDCSITWISTNQSIYRYRSSSSSNFSNPESTFNNGSSFNSISSLTYDSLTGILWVTNYPTSYVGLPMGAYINTTNRTIISGSLNISLPTSTSFSFNTTFLIINGSVALANNSTISLQPGQQIIVQGCASFGGGGLELTLKNSSNGSLPVFYYDCLDGSVFGSIGIVVVGDNGEETRCRGVGNYGTKSLQVVLGACEGKGGDEGGVNKALVIGLVVGIGGLLILVVVALIVVSVVVFFIRNKQTGGYADSLSM